MCVNPLQSITHSRKDGRSRAIRDWSLLPKTKREERQNLERRRGKIFWDQARRGSSLYPACSRKSWLSTVANEERRRFDRGMHRPCARRAEAYAPSPLRRYIRRTLTESGTSRAGAPSPRGRWWCSDELQYPGLKHVRSRPSVCIETGTHRLPRAPRPFSSWIFKLDIKGAKSPHERALTTGAGISTSVSGTPRISRASAEWSIRSVPRSQRETWRYIDGHTMKK